MNLSDFNNLGYLAYTNNGPRAAIQHQEVADALAGRKVGDPVTREVLGAFNRGWCRAADEEAARVLGEERSPDRTLTI